MILMLYPLIIIMSIPMLFDDCVPVEPAVMLLSIDNDTVSDAETFFLSGWFSMALYCSSVRLSISSLVIPSNRLCFSHSIVPPSQIALLTPEFVYSASFCPESPLQPCSVIRMSPSDIRAISAILNLTSLLLQPTPGPLSARIYWGGGGG